MPAVPLRSAQHGYFDVIAGYPQLGTADRNFYNWKDWCLAAGSDADLLWRVKEVLRLPVLGLLPDGSCRLAARMQAAGVNPLGLIFPSPKFKL